MLEISKIYGYCLKFQYKRDDISSKWIGILFWLMDLGEVLQRPCHTLELVSVWERGTLFISVWRKAADINSCLIVNEKIDFFKDGTFLTQVTNP